MFRVYCVIIPTKGTIIAFSILHSFFFIKFLCAIINSSPASRREFCIPVSILKHVNKPGPSS